MKLLKYLLIIPARCGSKGIFFKNIVNIKNKPLIYYTLNVAKSLFEENLVDQLYVSTDCIEIAKVCEDLGFKIEKLRSQKNSTDNAKTVDVILEILEEFNQKKISFENIIILQPTSPLRTYKNVKEALCLFQDEKSDSLISVFNDETLSMDILYKKKSTILQPIGINHNSGKQRQKNQKLYIRNGAIYIVKVDYLLKNKKIISENPSFIEMNKIESINIDSHIDLEMAKKFL